MNTPFVLALVALMTCAASCGGRTDVGVGTEGGGVATGGGSSSGSGGTGMSTTGGAGGSAGTAAAGSAGSPVRPPSCQGDPPGTGFDCGQEQTFDCCAVASVPGGTFNRENNPAYPATVSPFALDVLEVSVGRFRQFVNAYPASRPKLGDGANSHLPDSGWSADLDALLPPAQQDLRSLLRCQKYFPAGTPPPAQDIVWSDQPGDAERAAMSCTPWFVFFAFCAWDGGRLPTLAEWQFAAVGGSEQRTFPWGEQSPDFRATLAGSPAGARAWVGLAPLGAGKWGHRDMVGNRSEVVFDFISEFNKSVYPLPCQDCANTILTTNDSRLGVDVGFDSPPPPNSVLASTPVLTKGIGTTSLGVRCARNL